MSVFYDDVVREVAEFAIANFLYKAIGRKRESGISYLTLHREFKEVGIDTEVLCIMADIELEEY